MTLFNDLNIRHIVIENDTYVSLTDLCSHFVGMVHQALMHEAEHMHEESPKKRVFFSGFVDGAATVTNALAQMHDVQTLHTNITTVEDLLKKIDGLSD